MFGIAALLAVGFGKVFFGSGLRAESAGIEVRPEAQARFLDRIRTRLADSIWQAGGCRSWYLDAQGRNTTLWPDSVMAYRRSARRARMADYRLG